ncbi:MAG: HEAT repeat domain-containing protein [Planctomycetes bacterium]|nr:HEAT repeat domain-containing protein [Planctomycetota bacterium]
MNHRQVILAIASVALLTVGALQFASPGAELDPSQGGSAPHKGEPEIQHLFASTRVTASSDAEELAPGAALRYETDWQTTHRIDSTRARSSQEILIQAVGSLDLVVLATRDDQVAMGFRMPAASTRLVVGGHDADAALLARDLATGATVRLTRDGNIHGFRFPTTIDARQRNLLRRLFATLRVPSWTGATAWQSGDGTPDYDAGLSARRTDDGSGPSAVAWTRSTNRQSAATDPAHAFSLRGRGHGSLAWDTNARWWGVIDHTDELHCEHAGAGMRVDSTLTAAHRLVEVGNVAVAASFDWDGPWESAAGQEDVGAAARLGEQQEWAFALRETTAAGEIERLVAILARGDEAAGEIPPMVERLRWLLRVRPDALGILTSRLQADDLDPTLAAVLCTALAGEGSHGAQEVLTALANTAASPERRGAALASMFHLSAPTPATVDAVQHLLDHETEAELRDMAMLLTGALARSECRAQVDVLPQLLAREQLAITTNRLDAWLEALGNSGRPEVLGVGDRYLRHGDPAIRIAAVAALRRIDAAAAVELLVESAQDTDPLVRLRSLEAMAGRRSERAAAALARATGDTEESVRIGAIHGLVERHDADLYRDRLLRIGRDDPSPRVREVANAAAGQLLARG